MAGVVEVDRDRVTPQDLRSTPLLPAGALLLHHHLYHLLGGRARHSHRPQTLLPLNGLSACWRRCFCRDRFSRVHPDSLAHGVPELKDYMTYLVLSAVTPLTPPSLTAVTIGSVFSVTHQTTRVVLVLATQPQTLVSSRKTNGSALQGGQCGA